MATNRLFAFNNGSVIADTLQYGNLAISDNVVPGYKWWPGPDEDFGYVIAHDDTNPNMRTEGARSATVSTNSIGFWRTSVKTDGDFLTMTNGLFNQGFVTASVAANWLLANGYWTSWSSAIVTSNLILNLDAGDSLSYPGSGTTWTDTVGNKTFTLFNNPTYSSNNGGYLLFTPTSSQYAASSTSLSSLNEWTIEVWHYYTGNNDGTAPAILTEAVPGGTLLLGSNVNFNLGSQDGVANSLQTGFFENGSWRVTPNYMALTANNWYLIVGTYDGATLKLYVNNTLRQEKELNNPQQYGTPTSSNGGIRLMRRWDNPDYWGGRLSVVRIYTGDILSTGVTQNYNAQKSRFGL